MSPIDGPDHASRLNRRRPQRRTACTECRRRKKKCPQGQPCSNCARQFPQLPCHYIDGPIRDDRNAPTNSPRNASDERSQDRNASLTLPYIQSIDALAIESTGTSDSNHGGAPILSSQISHLTQHMLRLRYSSFTPMDTNAGYRRLGWETEIDAETQDDERRWQLILLQELSNWFFRLTGRTATADGSLIQMRMARRAIEAQSSVLPQVGRPGNLMSTLPMEWNSLNRELLRLHIEVLSRFKVSLDGSADPKNYFMEHWSPFCLQDPFLLQIILYTSACFALETRHVHKHYVLQQKSAVYNTLRARVQSTDPRLTSDSTILGVAQLAVDSWLWGGTNDLYAHLQGLKTLIRLSGGLQRLGLQGFLSKIVLIHDAAIALAHETEPTIYGNEEFPFVDTQHTPLEVMFNCPLMYEWPSFKDNASRLKLHPATAQLLDVTRLLLSQISRNPDVPNEEDEQSMKDLANAILERLSPLTEAYTESTKEERIQPAPRKMPSSARDRFDRQKIRMEPTPEPHMLAYRSRAAQSPSWHRVLRDIHPLDASPPPQDTSQGHMYRCVLSVTLLYCRAISERRLTSIICNEGEFVRIWGESWKVSLTTWNETVGVYIWILAAIVPSCHTSPPARFVRSMFIISLMKIAVNNWHMALDVVNTISRMQKWLRQGAVKHFRQAGHRGAFGGEGDVEKHAVYMKELMEEAETNGIVEGLHGI